MALNHSSHDMPEDEEAERLRIAEEDLLDCNMSYILDLCQTIRANMWACRRDLTQSIRTGCRNYIVQLEFSDGVKWLLKIQQPPIQWSYASTRIENMHREIATNFLVRRRTTIPVPDIYAWNLYEDEGRNPFGKPFYIMQNMPGKSLAQELESVMETSADVNVVKAAKIKVARQLAEFNFQMYTHIGESATPGEFRIAADAMEWRVDLQLRTREDGVDELIAMMDGPYPTMPDGGFMVQIRELERGAAETWKYWGRHGYPQGVRPEDEMKEAHVLYELRKAMEAFLFNEYSKGPFYLNHGDLQVGNILVDEMYNILGIIDWECARLVDVQSHCIFPAFLDESWLNAYEVHRVSRDEFEIWATHRLVDQEAEEEYVQHVKRLEGEMAVRYPGNELFENGILGKLYEQCRWANGYVEYLIHCFFYSLGDGDERRRVIEGIEKTMLGPNAPGQKGDGDSSQETDGGQDDHSVSPRRVRSC